MLLSYLIFSFSSTDFSIFFSADFQSLENILGVRQHLVHLFVTELAPLGLADLVVLELAEVDVVLVSHAQRLDEKSCAVKHFSDIFSDIFLAFPLDNRPGVKEKSVQKRKIFLRKSLTRPNLPEYNGVSQGDTPTPPSPPPGGGGGGGARVVPTWLAHFLLRRYLVFLI